MRLDIFTVKTGLIKSRELAKEYIKNGSVTVNGLVVVKPSAEINESESVSVICDQLKYVGRGGLKLEKALSCFNINIKNNICIDIGASTGGFTDCMLQNGAKKVYAIDVGHDQLDKKLIDDNRVINMERTNIKDISVHSFSERIDFISTDVSFISLKHIFPKINEFLSEEGNCVVLVKPQFEAGKKDIGKNGIVKDKKVHIRILNEIIQSCFCNNLYIAGLDFSPVSGGDGNIEYLLYLTKHNNSKIIDTVSVVDSAFIELCKKR